MLQVKSLIDAYKEKPLSTGSIDILHEALKDAKFHEQSLKNYLIDYGVKPDKNIISICRQVYALRKVVSKKIASRDMISPNMAEMRDGAAEYYLGKAVAPATIVALAKPNEFDSYDPVETVGAVLDQAASGDVAGAVGTGISALINQLTSVFQPARWTDSQKDLTKLYWDITGRRYSGESPVPEYHQHLPEAILYFSWRFKRPIKERDEATKALGLSWAGIADQIKAKNLYDRNWKKTFTDLGLPVPAFYYEVNDSRNKGYDYMPAAQKVATPEFFNRLSQVAQNAGSGVITGAINEILGSNTNQPSDNVNTDGKPIKPASQIADNKTVIYIVGFLMIVVAAYLAYRAVKGK